MKLDLTKLYAAIAVHKGDIESNKLPTHEVWVPHPEKEAAKSLGVKWSKINSRFEIATENPETHPAARFLPANFSVLKGRVPFALKDEFKEVGVVSVPTSGVWNSYVMNDEMYMDVINALIEVELL